MIKIKMSIKPGNVNDKEQQSIHQPEHFLGPHDLMARHVAINRLLGNKAISTKVYELSSHNF